MDGGKKALVPHPTEGFKLGHIVDIGSDTVTVELCDVPGSTIKSLYDRTFLAEEYNDKDCDDNCALMYLNEATLLHNTRLRYMKNKIYTFMANILIAVNPYFDIPDLYSRTTIKKYQGKSLGTLPPHVYAIADKSFRDMKTTKTSQSIVVSGESGAGKTESTKYILRYLTENWGSNSGPIEQRILESNPLLEAFGNAKTIRNNNSSRFGKFVEIHFDMKNAVCGGYVSHYLLEKSRICMQSKDERNYHIFYRLCAGAPDELKRKLMLAAPDQFHYLNRGSTQYFCSKQTDRQLKLDVKGQQYTKLGCLSDPILDDVNDFGVCDEAMAKMGITEPDRMATYMLVAAVLHLGNVAFEDADDVKGGCQVKPSCSTSLRIAAGLMGVDSDDLRQCLSSRVMQTARGGVKGTAINVPLKRSEAACARDALAKAVYGRLFDYIVNTVNSSIPFGASSSYIGILDIAGFEYFQVNSFEQFCINYCNEKLQQFFNDRIMKEEQALYAKEGLGVQHVDWTDNYDCIELLEGKGFGILELLDEENKLPTPNPAHFTSEVHSRNKAHFRLSSQFLEKNNDALHASLECLMYDCQNPLLKQLFAGSIIAFNKKASRKLNIVSVGSKFRSQLDILLNKLKGTGTSFIRCIKPNVKMVDHLFEGANILSQLQCAGMVSVLELMQLGFPSRTQFTDLYNMYKSYLPPQLSRLDPRLFCRALFKALGLDDKDFKFGLTKVFFRPGKFAEFDQIMKSDPDHLALLVKKVKKWLLQSRWKKAQWCALSVIKLKNKIIYRSAKIVSMQSAIRMWNCAHNFMPKYATILKMKSMLTQLNLMKDIVSHMTKYKDGAVKQVNGIESAMDAYLTTIRTSNISRAEMSHSTNTLMTHMDKTLAEVKKRMEVQKEAEERERLTKIQQEMEQERKKKEEEESNLRALEEERRLKMEMEVRRKREVEIRRKQEEEDRNTAVALQAELDKWSVDKVKRQAQLEQEHRDRELALRLAMEDQNAVDDIVLPPPVQGSEAVGLVQQKAAVKKHNLQKWKYAELRDAINTSCDLELLDACRVEFHRRLKVYHSWKSESKKRVQNSEQRAPRSVTMSDRMEPASVGHSELQRFFRLPFTQPSDMSSDGDGKRGLWYAHFDGSWIARQMELYPGKDPILLVAGVDDIQMCELNLEETGLSRMNGAEVLEADFEQEWEKNKGRSLLQNYSRRVSSKHLQAKFSLPK